MGVIYLGFGQSVEETAKSIATLRHMNEDEDDDGDIHYFLIHFGTSFHFHSVLVPELQEIQELLVGTLHSNRKRTIKKLIVHNGCNDVETNNRCYEFLSQYLEGSQDRIKEFYYVVHGIIPMTVNDATRFASIISRSNCNIQDFHFKLIKLPGNDVYHFVFSVGNTFERIFTAVLDKGINTFHVGVPVTAGNSYYKKLIQRACNAGNSKLATNTTLKCLGFFLYEDIDPRSIYFNDDDIKPLLAILKINTGLDYIRLDGRMILSTRTQTNLMNAARDNTTLTRKLSLEFQNEAAHCKLRSSINNQVAMNRFWKNFTTHYKIVGGKNTRTGKNNTTYIHNDNPRGENHNDNNNDPNKIQATQKQEPKPKSIHRSMYPILLEKLTGKPQFLFQLLKSENSLLFGGRDWHVEWHVTRRRRRIEGEDNEKEGKRRKEERRKKEINDDRKH